MADAEDGPRAVVELVNGERSLVLGVIDPRPRGDLQVMDDLLKLQLVARQLGWRVRISECRRELRELFDLLGMAERFGCSECPGDQPGDPAR